MRNWLGALLVIVGAGLAPIAHAALHPLDPLTAEELVTVRDVLARSGVFSARVGFASIRLDEPPKSAVLVFDGSGTVPRKARVAVIDYGNRKAFDVLVDVTARRIAALTELNGGQPGTTDRDDDIARGVIDADPRIKRALVQRGLTIPGKVSDAVQLSIDWIGHDPALAQAKTRLVRVLFSSDQAAVSDYSPPVDGLMAVVDVYARRIVTLTDVPGVASTRVPHDPFDPTVRGSAEVARPVEPTQPAGGNVTVADNVVSWRNWRFRIGFNDREGLVLYQLGVTDGSRLRPVLYRASLSEVASSYGDPTALWSWVEYLDEAIFGLGALSMPVRPGREVPRTALLLSPLLPDASKPSFSKPAENRIYLYERDAGNLMLFRQDERVVQARATQLVVGFVAALGNYDYGFNWVFNEDGSFGFEVELAGVILTKFVAAERCGLCDAVAQGPGADGASRTYEATGDDRYGSLVHPRVVGVNHQHWFNLRLDFDVDGARNAVLESNLKRAAAGGADDRAFTTTQTVFGRAAEAARDADDMSARSWTIYNPGIHDAVGRAPGYTIMPAGAAPTTLPPDRADGPFGFTFHQLWVTPYRDDALFADGAYPNQAGPGAGDTLERAADASPIYDRDIVVWLTLGEIHLPRPEDFPLMPNAHLSVGFQPSGFFARNPALGLGRE
jgi:primary-amine oxidase